MTQQWAGEAKPAEVSGEALILEWITLGYKKRHARALRVMVYLEKARWEAGWGSVWA